MEILIILIAIFLKLTFDIINDAPFKENKMKLSNKKFKAFIEKGQPIQEGLYVILDLEIDEDCIYVWYDVANDVLRKRGFMMDIEHNQTLTDDQVIILKTFLTQFYEN